MAATGTGFTGPGKRLADATEGPWKRWKTRSRHARAIRFIETYCRAPKGKGYGSPLKLAGFQKAWLEETLAAGIDAAVLATPRGNGKSTFGGALALWALYDDDETGAPQVPIVATTVGQAIRSCYGVAVSMVKHEPELMRRALIYSGIGTTRVDVPFNEGAMFPIANDPDGLQGLDPSFAIVDEIGFQPIDSWDALQLAQGKRSRSLVVGVGTPGLDRNNALWHLRKLVKEGVELPGFVFREYAAPDDVATSDRHAWRVANPAIAAGFLQSTAIANAHARTLEGPFRAFRLGQWVQGVDSWLGADGYRVWENLTNPYDFVEGAKTYIGIDIALKHDTSAVVLMQQRPDGRWHAQCRVWAPSKDEPVDITDVMQYLREAADRYQVESIAFDPRFFDVPAKMLSDEGLPLVEVPQSVDRMTAAVGGLYEAIARKRLTHDGDDVFATQILNAVPRFTSRGFTLEKAKARGKMDAAIALALAYDQVQRHESDEPLYSASRGLREIG